MSSAANMMRKNIKGLTIPKTVPESAERTVGDEGMFQIFWFVAFLSHSKGEMQTSNRLACV